MAEHTLDEAREQAVKAGLYFARVLETNAAAYLAFRARGVTVVVAREDAGERLEAALVGGVLGTEAKIQRPYDEQIQEIQDSLEIKGPETSSEGQGASAVLPSSSGEATSASDTLPVPEDPVVVESLAQFEETFAPKLVGQLTPLYHVPTSQTWQGSRGQQSGNVHLHVGENVKLGRRVRKKGECLCSKKHGSYERPPKDETKMCEECVKVAADNGLEWSLS